MIDFVSSSAHYHRRSMSCLAVVPNHDHFDHPSFSNRLYDTIEISEDGVATTAFTTGAPGSSASPVQTRHVSRKSDGNISISQLQKSLSGAGITNAAASEASASGSEGADGVVSVATGSLGGKLVKVMLDSHPLPKLLISVSFFFRFYEATDVP